MIGDFEVVEYTNPYYPDIVMYKVLINNREFHTDNYGRLIDNWYGDDKKEIIIEKLKMFGFEDKISEFSERFDNYKDIVMKELS